MSLETVFAARDRLAELGCLEKNSQLIVSHVSQRRSTVRRSRGGVRQREHSCVRDGLNLSINQRDMQYGP